MKFSVSCLDDALEVLLPGCRTWSGVVRTTLMDVAAKQCFVYPEKFKGVRESLAIIVLRTASRELKEVGWMTFGDFNVFEELPPVDTN